MEDLAAMIDEINKAVDMGLSIACYGGIWDLSSYRDNSLFCDKNRLNNESFTKLIKAAHKRVREGN